MRRSRCFVLLAAVTAFVAFALLIRGLSSPVKASSTADLGSAPPAQPGELQAATDVFTIGVLGPFTGPSSTAGEEFQGAVNMAFDEIGWQVGPYEIVPVWIDSQSDATLAAQAYEQAITQEGVQAGVLNWHSSVALDCMEVVADYQVPHFFGFGATEGVNSKFNDDRERYGYWTTKGWPTPEKLSVSYVEMLEDAIADTDWSPVDRTVAVYGEDTDWGHGVGEGLRGHFEAGGWNVVTETYFAFDQTDFTASLQGLKDLQPAVVAGTIGSAEGSAAFLNQADEVGLNSVIIAEGLGWTGDWYARTGSSSNYVVDQHPGWTNQAARAFRDNFEVRYGFEPSPSAGGMAYDATNFLIGAMQEVYADHGELTSEALYTFAQNEIWTGGWSYADGIMMQNYEYAMDTIPDPIVGEGYYTFPVVQYVDGEAKTLLPSAWAEQSFTPPGAGNDSPTRLGRLTTLTATLQVGEGATYTWDFGDGSTGQGRVVTHRYAAPGTYTAVVTATGATTEVARTLVVIYEGASVPRAPSYPVKVGIVAPLSGPVKSFGESTRDGAMIAIQQAEDAGWQIETVVGDSRCDAQQAVSVTQDLIQNHGVHYVIGAVCSSASIPMSQIAEENQVLQISPSSTHPQVTKYPDGTNKAYVFRACFLDPFQGRVMASVARDDLGAAEAAVLYDEGNDYVAGLAEYFKGYFEAMGGSVPVFESYTHETNDFSGLLTQVQNANVDVLFTPDSYYVVNKIAEDAEAIGLQTTFLGADGWDSPDLQLDLLDGAYFSTHFWPGDPRQLVVDFVGVYSATHTTPPDALGALAYDAAGLLLDGIADAHVDDATRVRDAIADVMYDGVTGEIAFDQYGDPLKQAVIVKIEGGQADLAKYVALHVSRLAVTNDGPTDRGEPTTFTATVETGSNVSYEWSFGDGSVGSGPVVSHTYATAGAYTAILTAANEYNTRTAETVAAVRETFELTTTGTVTTSDDVVSMASAPEMTETLSVTYTPQAAPTRSPGDFELARGTSFRLEVRDSKGNVVTNPSHPVTMTIRYDEDALPSYLDEEDLTLRRYDEDLEDWIDVTVKSRDVERDRITVLLDHFSEFALLAPVNRIYLPLVLRSY